MIDELAAKVFATRDAAHREHWITDSYARHEALGAFYEAVPGALDALVECYQGVFGPLENFGVALQVRGEDFDIVDQMGDDIDWIEAVREEITRGDTSLANLLDAVVAIYQRALYKLTRFK